MSRKIIGITVGSPLPKPNLMQTDPSKGDYVKGKEEFIQNLGGTAVDDVLAAIPTVTDVTVTENADGSVTMVNTLSDGSTETIVVTADADGNPNSMTVNGAVIPVTWNEVSA